jgi:hypothetical protein
VILAANLMVYLAAAISHRESGETLNENFARYGLALLPLVLTSYMAFHLYYLIHVGVNFPIILWQTFKFEIFHQMVITVPPSLTHTLQEFLIWLGIAGSLVIGYRLSRGKHNRFLTACGEFLPHGVVVVCFGSVMLHAIRVFFY